MQSDWPLPEGVKCWNRSSKPTFHPEQYAYRPGRNAQQAVVEVDEQLFRAPASLPSCRPDPARSRCPAA
jgi:hypothetical protein